MPIVGVGTDIVAVGRFSRLFEIGGQRFVDRWFSAVEADFCLASNAPTRHLAARFAAKEATLKSLRLPWHGPLQWRKIEIVRDNAGRPDVALHGEVRDLAAAAGIQHLHVSLSHEIAYATATVIAVGAEPLNPRPADDW